MRVLVSRQGRLMVNSVVRSIGILGLLAACVGLSFAQQTASPQSAHIVATSANSADNTATAPAPASIPQLQPRDSRYHLTSGDSFDVTFELSPEFNQTVTVQPDG